MYHISWEEGAISIRGVPTKESCNKVSPWDPESNAMLLKNVRDPLNK
jgi:hypothetical protein